MNTTPRTVYSFDFEATFNCDSPDEILEMDDADIEAYFTTITEVPVCGGVGVVGISTGAMVEEIEIETDTLKCRKDMVAIELGSGIDRHTEKRDAVIAEIESSRSMANMYTASAVRLEGYLEIMEEI